MKTRKEIIENFLLDPNKTILEILADLQEASVHFKDVTPEEMENLVGADGKDAKVDYQEIENFILEKIPKAEEINDFMKKLVAQLPKPKDGEPGTDGLPGDQGEPGKDGSPDTGKIILDKIREVGKNQGLKIKDVRGLYNVIKDLVAGVDEIEELKKAIDSISITYTNAETGAEFDTSNFYTKLESDNLLADKVDKVAGKGLSANDFTDILKSKLDAVNENAEVNVQSDWDQVNSGADDFIKNKPSLGGGNVVGAASSTDDAITRFDGITGRLIKNSVVTLNDAGEMAGVIIDDFTNEIHADLLHEPVWNPSLSPIAKGTPVYFDDFNATEDLPEVALARADDVAKMPCSGLIYANIPAETKGGIISEGELGQFDTATPGWAVNDEIYVGADGTLTKVRPLGSNKVQKIAIVKKVHSSNGILKITGANRVNALPNEVTASDIDDFDAEVSNNIDVAASKNITDNISVTQPVDLDQMESDIAALDQSIILKGTWDASGGSFPGTGTAQAGFSWIVSVGGTVDGIEFTANDRIVAILDNASTTTYAANWHKLDYTDQVLSVFGRVGAVVSQAGDYLASQITNAFDKLVDTLDSITEGTTNKHFTATEKTKLSNAVTTTGSNEISGVDEKVTPADDDLILIEDSENLFVKKKIKKSTLGGGGGGGSDYILIQDQKPNNTRGGASTVGA